MLTDFSLAENDQVKKWTHGFRAVAPNGGPFLRGAARFSHLPNICDLASVMKCRSLDPLEMILSLTQQIAELRHRQHEALKSAAFLGITPEEAKSIGARRTELNDLTKQLTDRLACMWTSDL